MRTRSPGEHPDFKKTTRRFPVLYWFGLLGITPQQQPGSYQGGDDDDGMSVSLVEETGVPRRNHRPTASNWHIVLVSKETLSTNNHHK